MRCSQCNKFAAVGEVQAELDRDVEFDGETLVGSVTVTLLSECCGAEIATNTFDVEIACEDCCGKPDWETTAEEAVSSESTNTREIKTRKGPHKGQIRTETTPTYGYDLTVMVHCNTCGKDFDVDHQDHEPASTFEEVY
jgi:hypothetical protein